MGVAVDPKKPLGVAKDPKNPVGIAVDSRFQYWMLCHLAEENVWKSSSSAKVKLEFKV